ncbi:MAG: hypothetical protein HY645_09650 [Acidobacteria bacterium]|nr:hypothetical protein [Acidobacteriota bacterium]
MNPLLDGLVAVLILGSGVVATQWFAGRMYIQCRHCPTLNARRRTHCRRCRKALSRT